MNAVFVLENIRLFVYLKYEIDWMIILEESQTKNILEWQF